MASVTRHILSKQIVLILGTDGDMPCFHYVRAAPQTKPLLLKSPASGAPMELSDYGEIMESGWGKPNAAIRAQMEEMCGFMHDPQMLFE